MPMTRGARRNRGGTDPPGGGATPLNRYRSLFGKALELWPDEPHEVRLDRLRDMAGGSLKEASDEKIIEMRRELETLIREVRTGGPAASATAKFIRLLDWEAGPRARGVRQFPGQRDRLVTWIHEPVARKCLERFFTLKKLCGWTEKRFLAWIRGIAKPSYERPEGCVPDGIQDLTATEANIVINAATRLETDAICEKMSDGRLPGAGPTKPRERLDQA